MSEPIQSISQGNYILQGTVATSAGIVGDGSTQNPLRADETVLFNNNGTSYTSSGTLLEPCNNFDLIQVNFRVFNHGEDVRFFRPSGSPPHSIWFNPMRGNNSLQQDYIKVIFYGDYWSATNSKTLNYNITGTTSPSISNNVKEAISSVCKVVGINRINNA